MKLNTKKKSITLDTPITEIAFAFSIKKRDTKVTKSLLPAFLELMTMNIV